jgi:poly(A) polymerase
MSIQVPPDTSDVIANVSLVLEGDPTLVLVGGSVRDILCGHTPKDYDFATALSAEEVERRVRAAGKRAYTVGKRYGTIGFRHEGHFIEVTTYRSEVYDKQSRKPEVRFGSSLEVDLARRDFTINAMALTPQLQLIDPWGGAADLGAGLLRAVGQPQDRFAEDPLRMLRLLRFVARYGFAIDPATARAAMDGGSGLSRISAERINNEIDAILVAPQATTALQSMATLGLLPFVLPLLVVQLNYPFAQAGVGKSLWQHSLQTVAATEAAVIPRWAALLHDIGRPFVLDVAPRPNGDVPQQLVAAQLVDMTGRQLKWSATRLAEVQTLLETTCQACR